MNYIISASTDIGIKKETNQDSLSVKVINTAFGRMAFAILCDGMGGLAKGEVASASVIEAFDGWISDRLPKLLSDGTLELRLRDEWFGLVSRLNIKIMDYGRHQGIALGTTVVAMLVTEDRYYIINVGDSRAYEICDNAVQLTTDQTFVANEVAAGRMTEEQARIDSRRNVLLQCCGASETVYPDMFLGQTKKDAVYMLCSDGFRHNISPEEIVEKFSPAELVSEAVMVKNSEYLIDLNKKRLETDNISVALIRTY